MKSLRYILNTQYCILYTFALLLPLTVFVTFLAESKPVHAVGLKVSPLKYEQQIELGSEKTGHVDVSNPNDFTVTVNTDVQAFRQVNINGDLEFYEDEQIDKGIQFDVDQFELAPREAARIFFAIDSNALPEGGVYAALLFSTGEDIQENRELSSVSTSSRVGTLLILQNGAEGAKEGEIRAVDIPFWQFGKGIQGEIEFTAAGQEKSLAFRPKLATSMPIVGEQDIESGLVFPGNTRRFELERTGSYFGVFPVDVTDEATGDTERTWVFAATGIWNIITPLILLIAAAGVGFRYYRGRQQ